MTILNLLFCSIFIPKVWNLLYRISSCRWCIHLGWSCLFAPCYKAENWQRM